MNIIIINGANLNLLGRRETQIYGDISFERYFDTLKRHFPDISLSTFQSNMEGELINKIHEVGFNFDGIVLNAGAYTHTSIALADAIRGVSTPVVEVHISNIHGREDFRQHSYTAAYCKGVITGFGLQSYDLALMYFKNRGIG